MATMGVVPSAADGSSPREGWDGGSRAENSERERAVRSL